MVVIYNLGLAGYMILKGNDPLKISKEDGIFFEMSQEEAKKIRKEYFESKYKIYNDILRELAKKFKSRDAK